MSGPDNYSRFKKRLQELLTTSKQKNEAAVPNPALVPQIKQSETAKVLPKYAAILAKAGEEGVSMDDIDQLQEDLEELLNNAAIRMRFLTSEGNDVDGPENDQGKKAHDKMSLKRKRPEEKPKSKEQKGGARFVKKHGLPVNKFAEDANPEVSKVTLPRNETSDKFWASIEPYCADIGKDEIIFLENLIQTMSKDIDLSIPELGEHYAKEWEEEVLNEEQGLGKPPSRKNLAGDIKKFGLQSIVETFPAPTTQRLLAALLEEKVMEVLPKGSENGEKSMKTEPDQPSISTSSGRSQKLAVCMDQRLKRELVDQGILLPEDLERIIPEDEVVAEIKKCQQELLSVNEYNIQELTKLKDLAVNDLQSNQIKQQLDKVDNQILELYSKIATARKTAQKEEGEEFDKALFNEQITKEYEVQTDALLKRQMELTEQLNGISKVQTLYSHD